MRDGLTVQEACSVAGMPRATFYRYRNGQQREKKPRPSPRRKLSEAERKHILNVLNEPRFVDKAPRQVYATLADENIYLCSVSTMYRVLRANDEVRERRNVARHPKYKKPELVARRPNEVYTWDTTRLKGPYKGTYYYLYVILDIYSRYVVGWMVAGEESADLAQQLISETCARQGANTPKLTIHSDRGAIMTAQSLGEFLADLKVTKSLSRPRVSNDNCFSEAQFKTLKYCPTFPERFGSIEDARAFLRRFFEWYNNEHYHTGIALMTPATVHFKRTAKCLRARRRVLAKAYRAHPERFVKGPPKADAVPKKVWINPPSTKPQEEAKTAA